MSDVKRYETDGYDAYMSEHPTGEYVSYDDYHSLRADLKRAVGLLMSCEAELGAEHPLSRDIAAFVAEHKDDA